MSNLLFKHLFNKSIHSVFNTRFVCRQKSGTDLSSKIYVVVEGRKPGIYSSWEECELQIKSFKGMRFKKFLKKEEALSYLDRSIINIETLQPKKKKSIKQLKKILNQYREKWKNDDKDAEVSHCKSFEDSEGKIIHSSRFCAIYNSANNIDETLDDLVCTSAEVASFHLESGSEHEPESNNFTNSEDDKYEDFWTTYNSISYNDENYKQVRKEIYLCKNGLANLEENLTDDNAEIYEAFNSLGRVQQAEFEAIYSSRFSEACTNSKKKEEKMVRNFKDLSIALSNICNDGVDDPTMVCSTSTFSENNTSNSDDEFPPYLFDIEKSLDFERETLPRGCKSFEETKSGERIVDGYLELYTDGACYNNGKENAFGAVGIYFGRGSALNTSVMLEGKVTNNIAEIRAATLGLQKAYENGFTKVRLYTDSHYVIKCCNNWLEGWKKNNWKRPNGRPVLNKEELQCLDEEIAKMKDVKLIFVRGHNGIEGNENADKLARDSVFASQSDAVEDVE